MEEFNVDRILTLYDSSYVQKSRVASAGDGGRKVGSDCTGFPAFDE